MVLSRHFSGGPSHGNCDAKSSFGRKDSFRKEEPRGGQSDGIAISDPCPVFQVGGGHAMHLITQSEIVSGVLTSAESVASGSSQNVKAEAKHFDERKSNQTVELEAGMETQILTERKERPAKPSEHTVDTVSECTTGKHRGEDSQPPADRLVPIRVKQSSGSRDENVVKRTTEASEGTDSPCASRDLLLASAIKGVKIMHPVSVQLSPTSTFNSIDPLHEPPNNENAPIDTFLQTAAIQGTLQQVILL